MIETMLSMKEAAVALGLSRESVKALIERGELIAVRHPVMRGKGKNFRYEIPESEIVKYIERHKTGGNRNRR
jgi:excisionase family DNA binding protein